jgi:hypothetical protein
MNIFPFLHFFAFLVYYSLIIFIGFLPFTVGNQKLIYRQRDKQFKLSQNGGHPLNSCFVVRYHIHGFYLKIT